MSFYPFFRIQSFFIHLGRTLSKHKSIPIALLLIGSLLSVRPALAVDLQFLGDLDLAPVSPLQNQGIIGGGGDIRILWDIIPDWSATLSAGAHFFPTATNPGINQVTYETNTAGLVSIVPVTVGLSHVIYRTAKKNTFFLTGAAGTAFEFAYGNGHPTPEPYVEAGAGFSLKEFFFEERVGAMPLAFGAYAPSQPGALVLFITSFGVHFFQF
ncbi:MAG: hypothetical protein ACYC9S_09095 [Leptospirales bacterium]